ncbi:MAG: aspartyl/asparaginyl beta-hydroxylase domain-containing protein [Patiriisocius sp.]|uniref:aspartyl/asparaginyl beta-hydroxylase domain-containing protein n=1 Tax=Patiriisocius sp. TaxID=2822396 RepID=UPI003EF6CB52
MNNNAIKLPFLFSEELLLKDLKFCKNTRFINHYSAEDYEGSWNSISLRSSDGLAQNIKAFDPFSDSWIDTPLVKECRYFKEIIDTFECEKYAVRLLNLAPGSHVKEHTDHQLGYSDGIFRIHIPIMTP